MSRGVTLPELLVTVSIVSLVVGIAAPGLTGPLDTLAVEHAAGEIAGAHARARVAAVVESRVALLEVGPDSLTLTIMEPGGPVRRWALPGPARYDVAMAGGSRTLTFSPSGVGMGLSNASWTLTKGRATRRVVISRLGRLRIER
ncbi:MAG TPA: GspH/FimT family pseudopilin [Gemmatimonadales bacterium]|nr:GspH/FimT family pseudopilin [Gemmatimonadales bacterium]